MAKVRGSLDRALLKYPDLNLSRVRLIGWGAGQAFNDYYPFIGLPVEYTVCPYSGNQPRKIHGVEVRSPEVLRNESRDDVLIVIFAAHIPQIMNQIRDEWGDFRSVPAFTHAPGHAEIDQLQALARVLPGLRLERQAPTRPPSMGIFSQGPIFPYTPLTLAWHRLAYPEAYQCLVTWDHQPAAALDACRPWVDNIITLPQPQNMSDSRNAIFRSARAGAQHLVDVGVQYTVRNRSDAVVIGSLYRAIEMLFDDGSKNVGRFGFLANASWKHVPFHFAERFLISRSQEMLEYWSLPEDLRPWSEVFQPRTNHYQEVRIEAVECLLWETYARNHGEPVKDLADAYAFAAKYLWPVDDCADVLTLKSIPLFNLTLNKSFNSTSDYWFEVFSDLPTAMARAREESAQNFSLSDFFASRVG